MEGRRFRPNALANSVWHPEEGARLEAFVTALRESFEARVGGIDFRDPGALATVRYMAREGGFERY